MASPAEGHSALIEDYLRCIEALIAGADMARAQSLQCPPDIAACIEIDCFST
jgi:hypothetical protein